jgi:hypothetical protein
MALTGLKPSVCGQIEFGISGAPNQGLASHPELGSLGSKVFVASGVV